MAEKICRKCGSALTKAGAKFCTICGATVDGAETTDIESQETRALPEEQNGQTAFATNVLPAQKPLSYTTEEMPQVAITAKAEEMATEVIEVVEPTPVAQSLKKQAELAPAKQPSAQSSGGQPGEQPGGRKKLALAAAIGVVALVAAGTFFFVNSRKAPESQSEIRPAANTEPSTSAQPVAQPSNQQAGQQSGASANNQSQSQTRPQSGAPISEVKSPAVRNDESASKQQQAAANPTPEPPKLSAKDHEKLGNDYQNSGRYQEALQEYEYMRQLDPGNKDVYYLIGLTYGKMNQLEKALESYRQCTSGQYRSVAQNAVKNLEKKVGKVNAK